MMACLITTRYELKRLQEKQKKNKKKISDKTLTTQIQFIYTADGIFL